MECEKQTNKKRKVKRTRDFELDHRNKENVGEVQMDRLIRRSQALKLKLKEEFPS
jgi:hypothetical protein